jgi:Domain of Unknown Function (DUF1080)
MKNDNNLDPIEQNEPIAPSLSSDNAVINPFDQDDNPRRRIIILALSLVGVLGCCVLFAAAFFYFQPDQLSLVKQYFPSATSTFTQTPTVTPSVTPSPTLTATSTPNVTATAAAQQATDTAVAFQATAVIAEGKWRVILKDAFDSNKNDWYVKPSDDEYAKTTYEIANGKYTWDATAHKGFINRVSVSTKSLGDFYLSADMKQASGPDSADYGVVFREDAKSNFYYFGIDDRGQYALYLYNQDWSTLIDWTQTELIQPGESNRITVIGEGSHFIFFINDQYLTEITDDSIKNGTSALAVELAAENDHAVFEFDNVALNTPK